MALNTDKLEKTREEYASYVESQAQDILDKLIKNGGVHTVQLTTMTVMVGTLNVTRLCQTLLDA